MSKGLYEFWVVGKFEMISEGIFDLSCLLSLPKEYRLLKTDCLKFCKDWVRSLYNFTGLEMDSLEKTQWEASAEFGSGASSARRIPGLRELALTLKGQLNWAYVGDKFLNMFLMMVAFWLITKFSS